MKQYILPTGHTDPASGCLACLEANEQEKQSTTCDGYNDCICHSQWNAGLAAHCSKCHPEKQRAKSESTNSDAPIERETNKMDNLLDDLQSKLASAQAVLEEIQGAESEVEEFISCVEDLINNLSELPSVSVSLDFDSDSI